MKDYREILKEMFAVVFVGEEDRISEYFSKDYVQHVDGKVLHYEEFVKHVRVVKEATERLEFEFKTVVMEGRVVFTNHVVRVRTKEGREMHGQVIGEFRFDEGGKVCYCDELTRMESGEEGDRDLGSRY